MKKLKKNPYLLIFLSFMIIILIGAFLFWLPFSTKAGEDKLNFIDALFMATSSVCVTGLSVVPNVGATFSIFGKVVMAILIEIGGLSFLTIASFVIIMSGQKIGMSERYLLKENLNQETVSGTVKLVKNIVIIALSTQTIGAIVFAIILQIGYHADYSFFEALGIGIFHSISSFNNAGLDIFGFTDSMAHFSSDWPFTLTTMILIILGGLSSIVIIDVFHSKSLRKLSLHSKIVLVTTISLIVGGTILIKLLLGNDATFLESLFLSVSSRTAGFSSFDLSTIPNSVAIVVAFLMFIGASPCSTGGGVKTSTLFVIGSAIVSFITGKSPKAFGRTIPKSSVNKAFILSLLAFLTLIVSTFFVSLFNPEFGLNKSFFEVVSAFATVGLSMGITTSLTVGSKIVIIITMFAGRVGLLTMVNILNMHTDFSFKESYTFPEEKVLIG